MSDSLFRKKALERLSSPEELDTLLQITSPAGWLALAAMTLVMSIIVLWSIFGMIPDKVQGYGILMRENAEVSSEFDGRITEILVQRGDKIEEGDIIAKIKQTGLENDIRVKKEEISATEARYKEEIEALKSNISLQKAANESRKKTLHRAISDIEIQIRNLLETERTQTSLVGKGLITRNRLLETQKSLADARNNRSQKQDELEQIKSDELAEDRKIIEKEHSRDRELDRLKIELDKMSRKLNTESELPSTHTGQILEVKVNRGDIVKQNSSILIVEKFEKNVEMLAYIPAEQGKKVKTGMTAQVSPSTVKAEEYGFIMGRIEDVSLFPVSKESMEEKLRNPNQVKHIIKKIGGGTALELIAALGEDNKTESGFKWSSSDGPPFKIETGTLSNISVIVGEKKPIAYVIPILKKTFGLVQ